MTKVSVCCAYYNRADTVRDTIASLLNQTHADLEVVVVNDGSPDPRVQEVLESFADPRLKVIQQANTGFVPAIRRAVAESSGEYVAIQGAGDLSLPTRIAREVAVLDAEPEVGLVSCRQRDVRVGGDNPGLMGLSRLISLAPDRAAMIGRFAPVIHGEVMFRRSLYEKVGGYRIPFFFAQDRDLWLRMVEHAEVRVIDEVLYQRNHFNDDGVNANPEKVVQQRALAVFAIQCYHDRQRDGRDLIDRYGHLGLMFRRRSAHMSRYITYYSRIAFLSGKPEVARRLADLALAERWTLHALVLANAVKLAVRSPGFARLFRGAFALKQRIRIRDRLRALAGRA